MSLRSLNNPVPSMARWRGSAGPKVLQAQYFTAWLSCAAYSKTMAGVLVIADDLPESALFYYFG